MAGREEERPGKSCCMRGDDALRCQNCWPSSLRTGVRVECGGSLPPVVAAVWFPAGTAGVRSAGFWALTGWDLPSMPSCRRCWRWEAPSGRTVATGERSSPDLPGLSASPVAGSGRRCSPCCCSTTSTGVIRFVELFAAPSTRRASGPEIVQIALKRQCSRRDSGA